ncbi:hypothetical protein B0T19DRAFT_50138 [Cercophora scortea]|uniref:Uncharacterized protein n=1 Tax=Cercophora scortea TaxID=314031 RepID=A0AAE0J4J1_9PEZI|nr:hypothetical protein B0T19DRAFT_50138 [Cercophora scortea]
MAVTQHPAASSVRPSSNQATTTSSAPVSPRRIRRPSTIRRANIESFTQNRTESPHPPRRRRIRTRSVAKAEEEEKEKEKETEAASQQQRPLPSSTPAPAPVPTPIPAEDSSTKWRPSIVIDSPLTLPGEDPSRIELADRKIAQHRLLTTTYPNHPDFPSLLDAAILERSLLSPLNDENTKPLSTLPSTHALAITKRLNILRSILTNPTTTFPPERTNIEAAIAGYTSGLIPYSDSYTILWAGHIVDTCPSYASFTSNRAERINHYFAQHGEGWLWYEPPLTDEDSSSPLRGPPTTIVAKRALCLPNPPSWRQTSEGMGHYELQMGFRRRKDRVTKSTTNPHTSSTSGITTTLGSGLTRLILKPSSTSTTTTPLKAAKSARRKTGTTGSGGQAYITADTEPDPLGPLIFFNTLLDSGATFPCLFASDLSKLGIDPSHYSAQTARPLSTADSVTTVKMYELDVAIVDPHQHSLKTPNRNPPIYPSERDRPLGGTIPVVCFGHTPVEGSFPSRLSGMLPFHVCYMSSTPGKYEMWLSEDRREVLGTSRMPGQMYYHGFLSGRDDEPGPRDTDYPDLVLKSDRMGTPVRVTFEHDFVDKSGEAWVSVEVDEPSGSTLDFKHKDRFKRELDRGAPAIRIEPRKRPSQQHDLQAYLAEKEAEEEREAARAIRRRFSTRTGTSTGSAGKKKSLGETWKR